MPAVRPVFMHHSLASGVLLRLPGGGANFVLCLLAPGHFVFILTADWKQRKHRFLSNIHGLRKLKDYFVANIFFESVFFFKKVHFP